MTNWWTDQLGNLNEVLKSTPPHGYILTHNSPDFETYSLCELVGQELAFQPTVSL